MLVSAFVEVKDVVSQKSGSYREEQDSPPVEWGVKTCLSAEGRYFSYVRVADKVKATEAFQLLEIAENTGFRLCADMIAEACDGKKTG